MFRGQSRAIPVAITSVILLIVVATTLMQKAVYGWDVVPYVGIAKSFSEDDKTVIHKEVYAELKEKVDPPLFEDLIALGPYRASVYSSPENLKQQYPFYSVKPAYPALIQFFSKTFSITGMEAAEWVAKVPMCILLLTIFFWSSRYLDMVSASLLTLGISVYAIESFFAAWMTPDPLSGMFFFLACYFFVESKQKWSVILLFPPLILTRPDLIMFAGLVLLCWFLLQKNYRIYATLIVCALTAQYLTQSYLSGNYGWKVLFHHSFVEKLAAPESFTPVLTFTDYVKVYLKQIYARETATLFFWCSVALVASLHLYRIFGYKSALTQLSVINLIYICVHWLVFPEQHYRLLFTSYVLIIILVAILINHALKTGSSREAAHGTLNS